MDAGSDTSSERRQYVAVSLQTSIDIQLGPDGHPWVRMQFATPALSTSLVFPSESAEDVIHNITEGIRKAVRSVTKKQMEVLTPDFTNIKAQNSA